MKISNKLQREVSQLASEMDWLSLKMAILLRQKLISERKIGYFNNKTARCMVCGHKWEYRSDRNKLTDKCPCCNNYIEMQRSRRTTLTPKTSIASISEAYKDWQVTRVYVVDSTMSKDGVVDYSYTLIQECWDSLRGEVLFQCQKAMNYYYSRKGKGLVNFDLRRNSSFEQFDIDVEFVESITPDLRKRGFDGNTHGYFTNYVVKKLLKKPDFESYWKRGLYTVAYMSSLHNWSEAKDGAVKVFLRHSKWRDSAEMQLWFDMVDALISLHKDIRNPKFICPDNIAEAHDHWMRIKAKNDEKIARQIMLANRMEAEKREAERARRDAEMKARFAERIAKFKDMTITHDNIVVRPLMSVDEFVAEGEALHHCVFQMKYYDEERHPNCLILSAREGAEWEKRLETIEVDLMNYRIVQSRGKYNSNTSRHKEIVKLINDNMDVIRKFNSRNITNSQTQNV